MNTKLYKNKTAIVAFRTHQDIKEKVNKILTRNGLDTSMVLNMVMQNIAISGKSPVSLDREMSPKLIKIIKSVEKEDKSKRKSFSSANEAIAFLKTI
jgi:addiction module RelB/DinJ family antitoxin